MRHSPWQVLSMACTTGQYHGDGLLGDRSLSNTLIDSALLCPGPGLLRGSQTIKSQVRVPDGL